MKYIIVAFRIDQENSTYYTKATTLDELSKKVAKAFQKGAHFVSLRKVE